jgi:PPM family protein phosphatase
MFSRWKKSPVPVRHPDGLVIRVGAATDVGQVRSENQDALGLFPEEAPRLFVVCDGMGGHKDGGLASRVAVQALAEAFAAAPPPLAHRLRHAVESANAAVWNQADSNGAGRRMGTTCTALGIGEGRVVLAHVGDSRAYRVAESALEQVSDDHTVAAEMQATGVLTASEAARHPRRHALTRALGSAPDVEVLIRDLGPPRDGDKYLLCSDGLAPVEMHEVHRVARDYDPQEAAEWLVAQANANGGPDNITVLILEIASVE